MLSNKFFLYDVISKALLMRCMYFKLLELIVLIFFIRVVHFWPGYMSVGLMRHPIRPTTTTRRD